MNSTVFDIFQKITRFDIKSYFEQFADFVSTDYQKISDFYSKGAVLKQEVIDKLERLNNQMRQLNDLFSIYSRNLSEETAEIWELLDFFESTKVTLLTMWNSSRWMRSTKDIFQSSVVKQDYNLRQGQNFETLATELGYNDANNNWAQIAIDNDIREEDYTYEGGKKLKISFVNDYSFQVNTVIDSISGERLYGKDIDRVLTFENNDLKTLGYHDTIRQQTAILLGLMKGSVPEFLTDGINKDVVGSNINALQYPMLLRQQASVFEKDGRYRSIEVNKMYIVEDSLVIELQITTRLGEVLDEQLILNTA